MKRLTTRLLDTLDADNERSCQLDNDAEYALSDAGFVAGDEIVIVTAAEAKALDGLEAVCISIADKFSGPDHGEAIEICDLLRELEAIRANYKPDQDPK